jgi:hypothetical protein
VPQRWRQTLDEIGAATRRGLNITARIAARPAGCCSGSTVLFRPIELQGDRTSAAAEKLAKLRQPTCEGHPERDGDRHRRSAVLSANYDKIYCSAIRPTGEQPRRTLGARPGRWASSRRSLRSDASALSDEGRGMLYVPFLNYIDGNFDATRAMLTDRTRCRAVRRRRVAASSAMPASRPIC